MEGTDACPLQGGLQAWYAAESGVPGLGPSLRMRPLFIFPFFAPHTLSRGDKGSGIEVESKNKHEI
jgi:hypothetical protein